MASEWAEKQRAIQPKPRVAKVVGSSLRRSYANKTRKAPAELTRRGMPPWHARRALR